MCVHATGIWCIEAGDAAKHPVVHETALCPAAQNYQPQMSRMPELRNPELEEVKV